MCTKEEWQEAADRRLADLVTLRTYVEQMGDLVRAYRYAKDEDAQGDALEDLFLLIEKARES
ncbi:MAG: hypothetical protein GF334_03270 [Candidatus Altiarchaeales archaeon]|nr:hypothetical protein [Candidatus Altiarchaeales archaeon]